MRSFTAAPAGSGAQLDGPRRRFLGAPFRGTLAGDRRRGAGCLRKASLRRARFPAGGLLRRRYQYGGGGAFGALGGLPQREMRVLDHALRRCVPILSQHCTDPVSGDARRAVRVQYHSGHWTFGMDFHRPAGVWERAGDPGKGVYHRGTGTGGQEPYHHVPERAAQCGGPGLGGPGPTGGEGDPLRVQPELFGRGYPSTPGQLGKSDAARIQSGGPHRKALGLAPARAVHRLDCHLPSTGRGRPAGCTGPQVYYYKQAVCGLICTRLFAGLKVYL